ncbi:hypothetical protein KFE25_009141 [Diacronema lutheri]|uniref:CXXC-type domain-containing protein n=1 Tax=Diacronema lutheri TaxID=2081491 RepID=A0A8J6CHX0_DIALT|nr:hypothetical protein KFE25_009141 [Diacronema lutheri]
MNCLDKKQNGGRGIKKQACVRRVCVNLQPTGTKPCADATVSLVDASSDATRADQPAAEVDTVLHDVLESLFMLNKQPLARSSGTSGLSEVVQRALAPAAVAGSDVPSRSAAVRLMRCGKCAACAIGDCGTCKNCLDKPRYGGPGVKKQACVARRCMRPRPVCEANDEYWRADELQPCGAGDFRPPTHQLAGAPHAVAAPLGASPLGAATGGTVAHPDVAPLGAIAPPMPVAGTPAERASSPRRQPVLASPPSRAADEDRASASTSGSTPQAGPLARAPLPPSAAPPLYARRSDGEDGAHALPYDNLDGALTAERGELPLLTRTLCEGRVGLPASALSPGGPSSLTILSFVTAHAAAAAAAAANGACDAATTDERSPARRASQPAVSKDPAPELRAGRREAARIHRELSSNDEDEVDRFDGANARCIPSDEQSPRAERSDHARPLKRRRGADTHAGGPRAVDALIGVDALTPPTSARASETPSTAGNRGTPSPSTTRGSEGESGSESRLPREHGIAQAYARGAGAVAAPDVQAVV